MDREMAIRILDKETTSEAVRKLKYYSGFNEEKTIDAIEEAMQMGADALREQMRDRKSTRLNSSH